MKQQNKGFTLIEMVVVIVVLGVLVAVATPKFINLKRDAHVTSLQTIEGSLQSANALIFTKAVLQGAEKVGRANPRRRDLGQVQLDDTTVVQTNFGYLSNSGRNDNRSIANLETILNVDSITRLRNNRTVAASGFGMDAKNRNEFHFFPAGFNRTQLCRLEYESAQAPGEQPQYRVITDDC
ncbi:prepilin-type N-terminal cleavage/methylation domain-containing protein [Paraferrimonas haliotis]|uniref:Type IV pilin n=1 Tax=Paraferrimonas haliotis TaxID=2013866 RepID=A0AA37TQ70_9GAMM|nr:prepilin-type N-terminal cleavage/methylation domain-containing protein [Paraferrimonas haliotis]GLS82347.1 type IV pilin [Paraferrimonas haliotis]